jgi:hypothetical protein
VLELGFPFPGAQFLRIRTEPLVTNERVMSVAYPDGRLRVADGRFVEYRADDKFAGTALFELYDAQRPPRARPWSFGSAGTRLQGPSGGGRQQPIDADDSISVPYDPDLDSVG